MPRLLLIDDDPSLLDVLALSLEDEGFDIDTASDGAAGLAAIEARPPALVVSDVNMPGLDGFSLCRRLRARGFTAPVVLLTSRDGEIDETLGLELGADDYITKPFSTRVLVARIRALLRREALRAGASAGPAARLVVGRLSLDRERLEVLYAGSPVTVTVSEFRLLDALASRPGIVFSRDQLLTRVRGDDSVVVERIIDTYVRRLRRKIEAIEPDFDGIETVIGAGYRWREPRR